MICEFMKCGNGIDVIFWNAGVYVIERLSGKFYGEKIKSRFTPL